MPEVSDDQSSVALEFHPDAEAEMRAAARYYDERQSGLGEDFLQEVERAAGVAVDHPAAGTPVSSGFRWVLTRRFPYAVIYRAVQHRIEIMAVAHLRRRPGYWRARA